MQIVRAEQFRKSRWRNGRGTSAEIVALPPISGPADPFIWRFALADITADGPFSIYDGIDRIFTIITGNGVKLAMSHAREHIHARPLTPVQFPGDVAVNCTLYAGPCQALNFFALRADISASVNIETLKPEDHPLRLEATLHQRVFLFALSGEVQLGTSVRVSSGDAVLLDANTIAEAVNSSAQLYLARLFQKTTATEQF